MTKAANKETKTMTVAATIAKQLGPATLALLGAKDLLAYDLGDREGFVGGLRFRIGKNPQRATHVFVGLTGRDDYTVHVTRYVKKTFEEHTVDFVEGVYADQLHEVIESATALYTRF